MENHYHYRLVALLLTVGLCFSSIQGLGVNWGTFGLHKLPPKTIVRMMQDNGIKKVKIFDTDPDVLNALAKSGIDVMVAIPNVMLNDMTDPRRAKKWVAQNVTHYLDQGVKINLVGVGNEPFLKWYADDYVNSTFPALKNVQQALDDAGVGTTIKATVPLNADVYASPSNNNVPSAGEFRADMTDVMKQIVEFYKNNDAPFTVNIYPFLNMHETPGFPVDYAFFDGYANPIVDGKLKYENMFDGNYDTLVAAMKKIGFEDIPIIIGEVGWPTDGDFRANNSMAEKFYKGLLRKLAAKKGTPVRPNTDIEVYVFGLVDEDAKSILPGNFERHWGLFTFDGQPKFPMDLSGKGESELLQEAQGVKYMAKKWCVFNPNGKGDKGKVNNTVKYACDRADCTVLSTGSSCGALDQNAHVSYAYNMYYQLQNQTDDSCKFDGLAMETTKDPSQGSCRFFVQFTADPVEVLDKSSDDGDSSSGGGSKSKSSAPSSRFVPSAHGFASLLFAGLFFLPAWIDLPFEG